MPGPRPRSVEEQEARARKRPAGFLQTRGGKKILRLTAKCCLCGESTTCDRSVWKTVFKDGDSKWKLVARHNCWEILPDVRVTPEGDDGPLCCSACYQNPGKTAFGQHQIRMAAERTKTKSGPTLTAGPDTRYVRERLSKTEDDLRRELQAKADAIMEAERWRMKSLDLQNRLQVSERKRILHQREAKGIKDRISSLFGTRYVTHPHPHPFSSLSTSAF